MQNHRSTGTVHLFIEDLDRLRAKLRNPRPPLDRWWPHFLQLARHQSAEFPLFPSLAHLVTEERSFAELARTRILERVRGLLPLEYTVHMQYHAWCQSQPLARMAAAYDWVADSGVFSADEQREIAEALVGTAYKHFYLTALSRLPAADNQIMSMCFGCAAIGYLFGVKRDNDPRAIELFEYGVRRFPEFVGLSQAGGYSLEGSTYMDQIVMPSAALWAAFMEQITGEDHLSRRYPPNHGCLREALELDARMISPGGLQPPWDHYGFMRAMNKCGLAYLARKTGQHGWLSLITGLDLWSESDFMAWGTDDKLWTLLWWPDDGELQGTDPVTISPSPYPLPRGGEETPGSHLHMDTRSPSSQPRTLSGREEEKTSTLEKTNPPTEAVISSPRVGEDKGEGCRPHAFTDAFPSWVVPNTAAALDAPSKQLRWFQYWDRCGHDCHVGRPHVNPNAIILEAFGSPFLLDGAPAEDCRWFDFPAKKVAGYLTAEQLERILQLFRETGRPFTAESWLHEWAYGCIGGSNSVLVDGETWYAPREPKEGRAVAFAAASCLKAVSSESAHYYQPRYDVTEMRRTSLLVRDDYVITCDRIRAASPHRWTWQVFARPGTVAAGNGFRIETPEQTRCDVVPAHAYPRERHPVPGYVCLLESSADLLQFHQEGAEARFAFCFHPQSTLQPAAELTNGWRADTDAQAETERPWQRERQAGRTVALTEMPYLFVDAPAHAWRWVQRDVERPARDGKWFLRLEKAAPTTRVWVNGRAMTLPAMGVERDHDRVVPLVVDITDALRDGQNLIVLAAKPIRGKTFAGKAELCRAVEPAEPPAFQEIVAGCFLVERAVRRDLVVVDPPGAVRVEDWETDAWCALLDANEGAAFHATFCRGQGFAFEGTRADVAWGHNVFDCGDLSDAANLRCSWSQGQVHVESSNTIRIRATPGFEISWTARQAKPVLLNDISVEPQFEPISQQYRVSIGTHPTPRVQSRTHSPPAVVHRQAPAPMPSQTSDPWQRAVALGRESGDESRRELETMFKSDTWPVRCAAALSLGRRREKSSVTALMAVLRDELVKENYPALPEDDPATVLGLAAAQLGAPDTQDRFVKRWRVTMCCAMALGQIGDRRAVPLLHEILDRKVDFYPALAHAATALGRLGDPAAVPSLEKYLDYFEVNTRERAAQAIACLKGLRS